MNAEKRGNTWLVHNSGLPFTPAFVLSPATNGMAVIPTPDTLHSLGNYQKLSGFAVDSVDSPHYKALLKAAEFLFTNRCK